MAEKILMPRLSDTMTEGVIAAWHKKVGDKVKKGDLLAEIETDKATMELESYKDGTLLHLGGDKGAKIQVDELLAIVGNDGEDISSLVSSSASLPKEAAKTEQPAPKKETAQPTTKDQPAQSSLDISKMDEVVLMPRLSDTMEEGVISSWHKNVGDTVKKGEVLADIETDKATLELESYKNGTLLHVGAQKGEKIPVNGLLCIIGEKGKVDVDAIIAAAKGGGVSSQPAPAESPKAEATETVQPAAQTAATSSSSSSDNGRVKASPLAKKLAAEKGIDIGSINGTGDGGRITKADIDNYKASSSGKPAATTAVAPIFTGSTEEGFTDIPNSQIRNIIAKRLGESKFSAPHFYLTMEINMDNAMAARVQLNEVSPAKISFNDMVVKATALALRQHPAVNASWLGDKIRRYNHIHIGIAVAIEDGLIVPVVKFADQKTLPQIAAESKELAGKAKNKKLQPNEFSGNTFTISNLGMMDIDEFTAIINPPDSCIMAVGRIKEIVVKKADGFGTSNVMKVTMSCDHRSVDGALGAAFLQTFKKYLENPITMLL
ncbi:MAG: pyruvate dehydrogenase complex dihydrolipoamide acetyltransferase [Chitinophagaceae bacterium]|nr:pyruvate dehydrogenase complex dihydrolipoamide acetyltransferase [Chitinophagaceae bacterium]HQX97594.1 pyruvate dehydrogenase complex dihydrolipoamide acetyltransferase [Chitinophagaceae bacterium]HRA12629.1 pyruvate dehydrogenase complex dihydrolipoamide acetyltransferase [Chitinophagaceae bacterium]HRC02967.1 pyruvate dehydrogenase complex dihydrolipoamide acetyltransferase [Niabella sp.]